MQVAFLFLAVLAFLSLVFAALNIGLDALRARRREPTGRGRRISAILAVLGLFALFGPSSAQAQLVNVEIGARHRIVTPFVPSSVVQVPVIQNVVAPAIAVPQAAVAVPNCSSSAAVPAIGAASAYAAPAVAAFTPAIAAFAVSPFQVSPFVAVHQAVIGRGVGVRFRAPARVVIRRR